MIDIYFEKKYGEVTEIIEQGIVEQFKYSDINGEISHMFIKREISEKINNQIYYDLITPYGYGGPIITKHQKETDVTDLVKAFNNSFKEYCLKNNVVSEFIRFHPVIGNHKHFNEIYELKHIRNTLGTNLKDYENPFQKEFSKSTRKRVNRIIRDGLEYEIVKSPTDLDDFKKIYYSTMDRNEASDFYYFNDEYFDSLLENLGDNIVICRVLYEGKNIAMGLYFIYENYMHAHLSGTLSDYIRLSPAYLIRYAFTQWGKENGYHLIHHGGGTTNSKDDGLYKFKKRFSNNTEFNFYVGSKIWNNEVYQKLVAIKGIKEESDFFPLYRKK